MIHRTIDDRQEQLLNTYSIDTDWLIKAYHNNVDAKLRWTGLIQQNARWIPEIILISPDVYLK